MTYISRDPFARTELHRETVATHRCCALCGQKRKSGKLFRYHTVYDSNGRSHGSDRLFCSIGCYRSYVY